MKSSSASSIYFKIHKRKRCLLGIWNFQELEIIRLFTYIIQYCSNIFMSYLDQSWQQEQSPWNHNTNGSFPWPGSRDSWLWRHGLWGCQESSKGNPFAKSGNQPESMRNWCFLTGLPDLRKAWPHTKFSEIPQNHITKQVNYLILISTHSFGCE